MVVGPGPETGPLFKRCTTKSVIEAVSGIDTVVKLFDDADYVVGMKGEICGDILSGVLMDGAMIVSGGGGGIDNTGGIITGLFW